MLAVTFPGTQRALARQLRSQKSLSRAGAVGCSSCAEVVYVARKLTSSKSGAAAGGAAPHRGDGAWPTRGPVRRLSVRPRQFRRDQSSSPASSSPASSSSLGSEIGALLVAAAGGVLLATQGLPEDGNPAAMEEAERGGGHHHRGDGAGDGGGAGDRKSAGAAAGGASNRDSRREGEEEGEEEEDGEGDGINNSSTPPLPAPPDGRPEEGRGVSADGEGGSDEEEGDEDGEWEEGFPPEGRYRYYILSQEEAEAEATNAGGGAGGADAGAGGEGGGLKGRYHFVVIGEGTAADAAMESILRMQPEAEILCLSDEKPFPADDSSNTHTGTYESDFRLLQSDLAASFNQWRRFLTFRMEEAFAGGGDGAPDDAGSCNRDSGQEDGSRGQRTGRRGRSAYGLARSKEIRYHTYQPHDLVIEPERRCVRLLLEGTEVYYDKCLIANSGKPRHDLIGATSGAGNTLLSHTGGGAYGSGGGSPSNSGRSPVGDVVGARLGDGGAGGEAGAGRTRGDGVGGSGRGGGGGGRVNRLMSLGDFVSLELLASNPDVKHVTVLGGGFVGCEVALALAERGRSTGTVVHQVYAEAAPMGHVLPGYLAEFLGEKLAAAGIVAVAGAPLGDLRINLRTAKPEGGAGGRKDRSDVGGVSEGGAGAGVCFDTDYVVVASTKIDPKVDVATDSGLEIDQCNGGIVVNGLFEAVNGVYVAGSAASFFDPIMGRRRVGSHDHCVNSGLYAGYNMAASLEAAENDHACRGDRPTSASMPSQRNRWLPPPPHPRLYDHIPFWRSNLAGCGVVMEGLGEVDPSLRTMGVWVNKRKDRHTGEASYEKGIVYYMRDNKVAGILLLNLSDQLERAREVLRLQPRIHSVAQLKKLITLGSKTGGLIRVVDAPGSTLLGEP